MTRNLHHSYRSIPEHCDLQTAISNCLRYIISCPQIDLTLPCCSSLPLHTIVTDQFVPKETQKIAGLQLYRMQNICNGLTGDVLKIVLILLYMTKMTKIWNLSSMQRATGFCNSQKNVLSALKLIPLWSYTSKDTDHDKLQCILLEFQGENIPWYCVWIFYHQTAHMKYRFLFEF